jgi:AcrR family transcriptional regulator
MSVEDVEVGTAPPLLEDAPPDGPERPGLRERKKLRTRETIARVALDLFEEHGFRATTIAQIAERADVSPRTVSAYFPAKEDLLFPHREEVFERLRERLANRLPGELSSDALRAWFVQVHDDLGDKRGHERERARRHVIEADEQLRAYERQAMEQGERLLADAVAADLGVAPDAMAPRLAAAATVGALTAIGRFHDESTELDDPDALRAATLVHLDQAIGFLRGGIRELQAQAERAGRDVGAPAA